jgi:hypothetical protein
MVWIGWEDVTVESVCRNGVIFLLIHEGAATDSAGCSPRKREGRKDEAIDRDAFAGRKQLV